MNDRTYTVLEDQPKRDRWDVEVKTFPTLEKARNYLKRHYDAAERDGESDTCRPFIRNDFTGEVV